VDGNIPSRNKGPTREKIASQGRGWTPLYNQLERGFVKATRGSVIPGWQDYAVKMIKAIKK